MSTSMISSSTSLILERDLKKVTQEINAYNTEEKLWIVEGNINNSSGNLALHIAGAVHHFVGAVLGRNGYIRTRDREFSDKHIPKDEIIDQISKAIEVVKQVLEQLTEEDMEKDFPERIGGNTLSTGFFLIHLVSHINYHLGQINYHRRLLD